MKLTKRLNWKQLNWSHLNWLFWLSPILIIMGATAGVVAGSWAGVPSGLVIAGFVLLGLWLVLLIYTQPNFWGRRSTQVGTNALLSTLAVLAILGMVNFLAVRFNSRVDLTENQIFTLAPQSQEIAQQLQQPVKVTIFSPMPNPIDQQLLDNYRRLNSNFSYQYIDPQKEPGLAREYEVQTIGDVFVESGTNRRSVQTVTPEEKLSERRLTNGIAQITNSQPQKVYFLQGHGERRLEAGQGGFLQASQRLTEEGYEGAPLNLAENPQVPADASVLVIASPQRPLIDSEVNALRDYLKRKSGLMLLIDPQTDPRLNPLLEEWGIQMSDRIVIDPAGQASGLGPGVTIINQYGDHPITRGFGNGISFYPLARPVQQRQIEGIEAASLLITSDRTTAQRVAENGELQFDAATDPKGPFAIGYALSRGVQAAAAPSPAPSPSPSPNPEASPSPNPEASPSPSPNPEANPSPSPSPEASPSPSPSPSPQAGENTGQARLVVIGNSGFATDGVFAQQLNGDVFLNSMGWLSQRDDQVLAIRPREVNNRRIVMSPQQQMAAAGTALALLPTIAFVAAGWVWWKRR
jgi:ABC-type uncharacterized transport system involved in gliding motility auxiliary subunit